MMELKDICSLSYSFEDLQPFCIKTNKHGAFCIMSKWCVQVLKPQFSFSMDMNRFNFQTDRLQCPQSCTTALLDTQDLEIYESATQAEKQDILIDKRYLPKLSDALIQSCATAWSPPNPRGYCYLAYLSNYGGLEIFSDVGDGTWQTCLNVGNYWFGHLVKDIEFPIRNFKDLDKLVQDILFSTLCWDEGCQGAPAQRLLCATKCNKLVLFSIFLDSQELDCTNPDLINIQNIIEVEQKHVTALRWIQNDEGEALVVSGSLDGKICLYEITSTGSIELKRNLWDEKDHLAIGTIEYSTVDTNFLVIAVKGSHLLFFLLSQDGSMISDAVELIPGFSVTGLIMLDKLSFMITTLDGSSCLIEVELPDNQIQVKTKNVSLAFNLSNYSLYGLAASPNKAYFMLASFATQPYDHLILRQPANFVLCRSTTIQHVQTLTANPDSNIYFLMDYAEVVRYMGGKDMPNLRVLESQIDLETNIGVSDAYLSQLRAAVVIQAARYSYFRLRSKEKTEKTRAYTSVLYQIVEVIRAFHILQQLIHKNPQNNTWTLDQKQSGHALLTFIKTFVNSTVENERLRTVQVNLAPVLQSVLAASSQIIVPAEICTFCDEVINVGSLICNQGHQTPRCSITKLQIESISPVTCSYCKHSVIEDFEVLQSVTLANPKLMTCPLCNVPLGHVL